MSSTNSIAGMDFIDETGEKLTRCIEEYMSNRIKKCKDMKIKVEGEI